MRKINDLDIRRLKNDWPKIPPELWNDCDKAFRLFANSPRFEVLKDLRLDSFIDPEYLQESSLGNFSLKDILKRWPEIFFETNYLTEEYFRRIVELFVNLHGTSDLENEPELEIPEELKDKQSSGPVFDRAPRYLPSLEDEKKLRTALRALKGQGSLDVMVSEYWPAEELRAPFLEELSFEQLYELPLEQITEQRSFTKAKLEVLVEVINSFVEQAPMPSEGETQVSASVGQPTEQSQARGRAISAESLVASVFQSYWAFFDSNPGYALNEVVKVLQRTLNDQQHVAFWLLGKLSDTALMELCEKEELNFEDEYEQLSDLVTNVLNAQASHIYHHWIDAISGSIVKKHDLLACYQENCQDEQFHWRFGERLLFFLGAHAAVYDGKELENYLVKDSERFKSLTKMLFDSLPCADTKFREMCSLFFPSIDIEELKDFYGHWISFDAKADKYSLRPDGKKASH